MAIGLARAGDIFLSFVGKKIHVNIDYKNRSGFVSCFLLRFIELEEPVFALKDFDFALLSRKAFVEPAFDRVLDKKLISLDCTFENASFLNPEEKSGASLLFDKLATLVFERVDAELLIYGETVEFPSCQAENDDVKLYASGYVTESGGFELRMKIFFSPEIAKSLPEELRGMLTEVGGGWFSYFLHIRLDYEHLEVR